MFMTLIAPDECNDRLFRTVLSNARRVIEILKSRLDVPRNTHLPRARIGNI